MSSILTILTLTPLAGAVVLAFTRSADRKTSRGLAMAVSLIALGIAAALWAQFDSSATGIQLEQRGEWISTLPGADYHVGIDGLGLLMVLLAAIVTPVAILASRQVVEESALYFSMVLFLESGLFGAFTALNFFHWFLFWELSLIPAFFLIRRWGGPNRGPAATQFFVYTMVGSVAMLLAFLAIYATVGKFDFIDLANQPGGLSAAITARLHESGWSDWWQRFFPLMVFGGIFLGFAVKVPLVPFHTWLPNAYTEAPTGVTMLLTGVMSKMGVYGFLRILLPLFPDQMNALLQPLLWLAVATIILSAAAAFAQRDLKRVFAYSSINHLGYCLLGTFAVAKYTGSEPAWNVEKAAAFNGVLLQMFNHGLTASVLFCFIGFLEARSNGLRGLDAFGGLRKVAPVFCGLMGISIFASLGLPGLNGFVGEFLIFKGVFALASWSAALSVIGLLITAVFLLTVIQRVFNGPLNSQWAKLADLTWSERLIILPSTALMFIIGIYPQLVIGKINTTVIQMVDHLKF